MRPNPSGDSASSSTRGGSAAQGSNADAEDSAANIAQLVRRTAERAARPGPSSIVRPTPIVRPNPAAAQPHLMPAQSDAQQVAGRVAELDTAPARLALGQPTLRTLVIAVAAAALVGGALALANQQDTDPVHTASPTATSTAPGNPAPAGYTVKVTDMITDCAGHARGRTKDSFEDENCVKATRSLATGQVGGRQALFVTSRIQMTSPEAAAAVKQILDGNGTGNLNDLLRDGESYPEAPDEMPSSGYTSVQSGTIVTVAEAGFVDGDESSSTDPALRSAAAQVAALVSAQG